MPAGNSVIHHYGISVGRLIPSNCRWEAEARTVSNSAPRQQRSGAMPRREINRSPGPIFLLHHCVKPLCFPHLFILWAGGEEAKRLWTGGVGRRQRMPWEKKREGQWACRTERSHHSLSLSIFPRRLPIGGGVAGGTNCFSSSHFSNTLFFSPHETKPSASACVLSTFLGGSV